MKKVLIHLCCAPCGIYPIKTLKEEGYKVVGLFYNPNIHPLTEYLKRREQLPILEEKYNLKIIYKDDEYFPEKYLRKVAFRENNRCFYCYHMRIEKTISIARRGKFDFFTTTLLYSKFQKHDVIKNLCMDLSINKGVKFLYRDFREGWKIGIQESKELNMYRQQYCGCIYSEFERYKNKLRNL